MHTEEQIKKIVSDIYAKNISIDQIENDKNYFLGHIGNSYDAINILMEIEEKFKITFPGDVMDAGLLVSIDHISNTVYNILKKGEIREQSTLSN